MCDFYGQALKCGQLTRHVAAKLHLTAAQGPNRSFACTLVVGMTPSIPMSSIVQTVKRSCDRIVLP